ncbi:MAG TPA: M48 family metalloprotease [Planctomycetota bacterium]|nr:M48 family metalloprotease [Planctomycetota bacterium]
MKRVLALALLVAVAAAAFFVFRPRSPEPANPEHANAAERRAGKEMSREVERQNGLYAAPAQTWVDAVGKRLVSRLSPDVQRAWDFHFEIVDQLEPNAFALPGGQIYVTRGLLPLVVEEDELAGVLAHEVSHVTEHHAGRRLRRAILPALLSLPGKIVGVFEPALGTLIAAPWEVMGALHLASYSREQESDADRLGVALAARSGYDPRALERILARLEKDAARLSGKEHRPSFFDDHPSTPTRERDIGREASQITWSREAPLKSSPDVVAALDGVVWGGNPAQGVFRDELFLHPDLGFAVQFPGGWRTVNTASAVCATRGEDAEISISAAAGQKDPEAQGHELSNQLRREGLEPDEEGVVAVDGFPGYFLHVVDANQDASVLWLEIGGRTLAAVGLGARSDRPAITSSLLSLRRITDEERRSIPVVRLHAARAVAGETLARIGSRLANVWPPSYTAMVNGLSEDAVLQARDVVKIALREPYAPASIRGRAP